MAQPRPAASFERLEAPVVTASAPFAHASMVRILDGWLEVDLRRKWGAQSGTNRLLSCIARAHAAEAELTLVEQHLAHRQFLYPSMTDWDNTALGKMTGAMRAFLTEVERYVDPFGGYVRPAESATRTVLVHAEAMLVYIYGCEINEHLDVIAFLRARQARAIEALQLRRHPTEEKWNLPTNDNQTLTEVSNLLDAHRSVEVSESAKDDAIRLRWKLGDVLLRLLAPVDEGHQQPLSLGALTPRNEKRYFGSQI